MAGSDGWHGGSGLNGKVDVGWCVVEWRTGGGGGGGWGR